MDYTADAKGVCQGNLFVHTVLIPYPTITDITFLVRLLLLDLVLSGILMSKQDYVFSEVYMLC